MKRKEKYNNLREKFLAVANEIQLPNQLACIINSCLHFTLFSHQL